ncbi:MAG: hypothetical protein ACK2UK_22870, partial [Candidatus Promineifilaceae bacterium]
GRLSWRVTWGVTAVLALLIALGDHVPDYPLLDLETPAWYESLAAEPGQFGLVTIPFSRTFDEFGMSYQLTHNKALAGGHVSRPPREAYAFIDSTPFLDGQREQTPEPPADGDISGLLRPLAANNLPYLVIHKRFLTPAQVTMWRNWLGIPALHDDAELLVYPTGLAAGEDFEFTATAVPGLGYVAGRLENATIGVGEPLQVVSHWALAPGAPRQGELSYTLLDETGEVAAMINRPFSFAAADGTVQLAALQEILALPQTPAAGTYRVKVELVAEDGRSSGEFDLGLLYVTAEGRVFDLPHPQTPLAISFGDTLSLAGVDGPLLNGQSLDLTLFWQMLQETDISYKIFVHLFDATSGDLVAQLDTVPRDWQYPTNAWHSGEYVSDRLSLATGGLAPGAYRLEIGVYHPDTGERLTAVNADGNHYENDTVPLGEVTINN